MMNFLTEDNVNFRSTDNTPKANIVTELTAGIYEATIFKTERGPVTQLKRLKRQEYKRIETGEFKDIMNHYENFFSKETRALYKEMDIRHKSNLLLHGPPGTGKSGLAYLIAQEIVKNLDGIALYVESSADAIYLADNLVRNSERPLIFIQEELDRELNYDSSPKMRVFQLGNMKVNVNMGTEASSKLLTFLDSPTSQENFCFIATTNYIEDIPLSLRNRPSRFELVKEISKIPDEVVHELVDKLIPASVAAHKKTDLTEFKYKLTEKNVTIDQIKTAIVLHVVHNKTIDQSVEEVVAFQAIDEQEEAAK